jgi:putative acetyltransferase
VIRQYRPEDKEAVLAVWYDSARIAHPFWTSERFDHERQAIGEQFLLAAETYVCEHTGAVVGFISLLGVEVGGLFVAPRCQRQGIGRALMDQARATRDHLELDVFEENLIGRSFYMRYGFRVVGGRVEETTGLRVLRLGLESSTLEGNKSQAT